MYTMRVRSIGGNPSPDFNKFIKEFSTSLALELDSIEVIVTGVNFFLGRQDHFTIHGFRRRGGGPLEHGHWVSVNQVINSILDRMEVVAFVCATESTSTYTVRSSREE